MVTFLPSERPRFIFIHWERWPLTGPRYRFSDSLLLTRLIPATEAKSRFGELLESAPKDPVEISKKGRRVTVALSVETFQELKEKAEEKSEAAKIDGILNGIKRPSLRTSRWTNRVIAIISTKNTPEDSKFIEQLLKPQGGKL